MDTDARRPPPTAPLRRGLEAIVAWTVWLATSPKPPHRLLLTSLPKAGTNLVRKALTGMSGTRPARTGLFGATAPPPRPGRAIVPIGVDWPRPADAAGVRRRLRSTPPGTVLLSHAPRSTALADIVTALDVRVLAIVRDPRAVAASLVPFVLDRPGHFLHDRFSAMAPDERVRASIAGLAADDRGLGLRDVGHRLTSVAAWADDPNALLLRLEDLVGPQGGGDATRQRETLAALAAHVGASADDDTIAALAEQLFGGTATFRRGSIDAWRDDLGPADVALVREVAGEVGARLGYDLDL